MKNKLLIYSDQQMSNQIRMQWYIPNRPVNYIFTVLKSIIILLTQKSLHISTYYKEILKQTILIHACIQKCSLFHNENYEIISFMPCKKKVRHNSIGKLNVFSSGGGQFSYCFDCKTSYFKNLEHISRYSNIHISMNVGVDLKIYYEYFKYFPGFCFFYYLHFQRINDL